MPLFAIVAMSTNRVIGKDNQLPWHLPADLQHFKQTTTGKTILMGRKTHESIGRALPNRRNVILTRDPTFKAEHCEIIHSLDEINSFTQEDVFVIGGAELFQQLLPQIERLYLTLIDAEIDGDTFFPQINLNEWRTLDLTMHAADPKNPYPYQFMCLERIKTNTVR